MMTFVAVFFGTLTANLTFVYVLGLIAQRNERKKMEQMQAQMMELQKIAERENERMKNYAAMEG